MNVEQNTVRHTYVIMANIGNLSFGIDAILSGERKKSFGIDDISLQTMGREETARGGRQLNDINRGTISTEAR